MRQKQDPWHKPRSPGNHFTEAEVETIRAAFESERKPKDVAEQLRCSQRSVNRYFAKLRSGQPISADHRKPAPVVQQKRGPVDRFYRGNFDL